MDQVTSAFLVSMVVEHVLTPEFMSASRHSPTWVGLGVGIAHAAMWALALFAALAFFGEPLSYQQFIALFVAHWIADGTPIGRWAVYLSAQLSVDRALRVVESNNIPPDIAALEFALAAAHEQMVWLTLHLVIVFSTLTFVR